MQINIKYFIKINKPKIKIFIEINLDYFFQI